LNNFQLKAPFIWFPTEKAKQQQQQQQNTNKKEIPVITKQMESVPG